MHLKVRLERIQLFLVPLVVFGALTVGGSVQRAAAAALQNNGSASRNAWVANETALSQAAVTSGSFGQRFATHLEGTIMGQPVVVGDTLIVGTEEDRIYGLNRSTGEVSWSRVIGTPIQQAREQACDDIPVAGITSSPVVDTTAGAVYFLAKTYSQQVASGMVFQLHKVSVSTGAEFANFPVTYVGVADNDPTASFDGALQTQRTGLLLDQGVIYAGFASVCDAGDFKGWVIGIDGSTGSPTARFVTEPGTNYGGGVWQSGVGIASDGPGQLLLTTGNGTTPTPGTPGSQPPAALGQSIVRLTVQGDRTLKATDFFTPVTGPQLNVVDGDLGSGGPVLLPSPFQTATAPQILANGSKGGYLYLVNAKNLGGMGTGANGGDATVTTLGPIGAMYGSPVGWSGGGGYLYASAALPGLEQSGSGPSLVAYKWGVNANGGAALTLAGSAKEQPGFGSSSPVISSNGTALPSAVLWQIWRPMVGGNAELRAFNPIPVNGQLQQLWSAPVGPLSKFLNPVIENGFVYVGSRDGTLYGFGLTNPPSLVGSSLKIAPTTVGSAKVSNVVVTATRTITIKSVSSSSPRFAIGRIALPRVLSAGSSLVIPVTFSPATSGSTSAALTLGVNGEANVSLPLNSYGIFTGPRLTVASPMLQLGNGALGGGPLTNSFTVTNVGSAAAAITSATGLKAPFALSSALVGKVLSPGQSLAVSVKMTLGAVGQFTSPIAIGIKGQTLSVSLVGSVGQPAIVTVEPSSISFGAVGFGQSVVRSITLTNTGNTPANWYVSRPYFIGAQEPFSLVGSQVSPTIAAHSRVVLKIRFSPDPEDSDYQGMMQFNIDDGLVPRQVWFSGSVEDARHAQINVDSVDVFPGDTTAWVPVELSPARLNTVSFTVATADGTATAQSGAYTPLTSFQTSFSGGQSRTYIPIAVTPSLGAGQQFSVRLLSADGATLGTSGTVYIRASKAAGVSYATLSPTELVVNQVEDQVVEVPVAISPILSAPVTCRATTTDGTASAANGDYVALSNQLVTIPPTGRGSIPIVVKSKALPFDERSFSVALSGCSGDGTLSMTRSSANVTLIGQLNQPSSAELQFQKLVIIAPSVGTTAFGTETVRNIGGAPITLSIVSPVNEAHFGLVGAPSGPVTIAPGGTYTLRFSYRPTSRLLTRASLSVQASTDQFPQIINVLGESN